MSRAYSPSVLADISDELGVEQRALAALLKVEALGSGFLPDGRPKILFERHKFSQYTRGGFDALNADLSNPKAGGYVGGAGEWLRLYRAMNLGALPGMPVGTAAHTAEAALRACSWGMPQILGDNWKRCGEASLYGFILAMHHNEDAQLRMLSGFIRSDARLLEALRRRDWPSVALFYNGPAFARNKYDVRLAQAYAALA